MVSRRGLTSKPPGMAWFFVQKERRDKTVGGAHVSVEEKESLLRFTRIQVYFLRLLLWTLSSDTEPARFGVGSELFAIMSKAVLKKTHWTSRVNECAVSKDARGDLNVSLRGGAENGEFAYIGHINEALVGYHYGQLGEGELLLEVETLSISGLPLYDVETVIKNCKSPVRLKTVRPGKSRRRRRRWWLSPNFVQILCLLRFLVEKKD